MKIQGEKLKLRFQNQKISNFKEFVIAKSDTIEVDALMDWLENVDTEYDKNNLEWAIDYQKKQLLKLWKE